MLIQNLFSIYPYPVFLPHILPPWNSWKWWQKSTSFTKFRKKKGYNYDQLLKMTCQTFEMSPCFVSLLRSCSDCHIFWMKTRRNQMQLNVTLLEMGLYNTTTSWLYTEQEHKHSLQKFTRKSDYQCFHQIWLLFLLHWSYSQWCSAVYRHKLCYW